MPVFGSLETPPANSSRGLGHLPVDPGVVAPPGWQPLLSSPAHLSQPKQQPQWQPQQQRAEQQQPQQQQAEQHQAKQQREKQQAQGEAAIAEAAGEQGDGDVGEDGSSSGTPIESMQQASSDRVCSAVGGGGRDRAGGQGIGGAGRERQRVSRGQNLLLHDFISIWAEQSGGAGGAGQGSTERPKGWTAGLAR